MKDKARKNGRPETFFRNGQTCILCHARKKLIVRTEEEEVRQNFILELTTDFGYSMEQIEVEVPLSRVQKGARGRADIVVYYEQNLTKKNKQPLIVIECKEPNEPVDFYEHEKQLDRYNQVLKANVKILTNGGRTRAFKLDAEKKKYIEVEKIPTYSEVVNEKKLKKDKIVPFFQPVYEYFKSSKGKVKYSYWEAFFGFYTLLVPYEAFSNPDAMKKFYKWLTRNSYPVGSKTDQNLLPYVLRVMDVIYHPQIRVENLDVKSIEFVKDLGFRFDKFGYPGGNLYGFYRYFMIKDKSGNNQIISLAIYSTYNKTYLMVGIDDYEKKNHVLELCLDTFLLIDKNPDTFSMYHDGRLTIAKQTQKRADIISFVKKHASYMINNDLVVLGNFNLKNDDKEVYEDNIVEFLCRVIEYAVLRNNYKKQKSKQKN